MDKATADLAREIEASLTLGGELADQIVAVIRKAIEAKDFDREGLDSTDRILAVICEVRPGWSVSAKGIAHGPNGHWRCTLRKSGVRDNDEYIGVGRGPNLPHAMLAALVKVLAFGH